MAGSAVELAAPTHARSWLLPSLIALLVLALAGCLPGTAEPVPQPSFWRLPRGEAPPRENPDLRHGAADLERAIRAYAEGYAAEGAPIPGRLDRFRPLVFQVEQGKCYLYAVRLAPGATLSAAARERLTFAVRVPEDDGVRVGSAMHGPGGMGSIGCPPVSGQATMELIAGTTPGDPARALGRGGFTVELFSRPIRGEGS